ncbi:MAG TPA: DUF1015 domain-containing protein [Tepidisphaeraceae bacterium]|nr:DUF1015 domain-containing protein [Tepidisphaeraceae bacterium]
MAQIRPFAGVRYSRKTWDKLSNLIAPPYDVLDEAAKRALQSKHPQNIVTVDLPHLPAKTVGPDSAYVGANDTLQSWLSAGILSRDPKPAIYPYSQTYTHGDRTFHRRGVIALVKLSPFGEGHVVPHEKTYPDAIEDRLKLTRATRMQLSPIFGLFSDPRSQVTELLYENLGKPEMSATLDGVQNDLWTIIDSETENAATDLMGARPVYIADGHHRYTMALQYQKEIAKAHGGPLPPGHPANFCMFVLVGMQDDGLLILPTHRLISGLKTFDINAMKQLLAPVATVTDVNVTENQLPGYINDVLPKQPAATMGLFDGRTRKTYQITFINPDVLKSVDPNHSPAWRQLDVAIVQRYLLDEILKPKFAGGAEPGRGYTADSKAVAAMTDGKKFQIALLLKSTPLRALEELGKTNEVMPPKSTFFYPKLATGMVMNPLY